MWNSRARIRPSRTLPYDVVIFWDVVRGYLYTMSPPLVDVSLSDFYLIRLSNLAYFIHLMLSPWCSIISICVEPLKPIPLYLVWFRTLISRWPYQLLDDFNTIMESWHLHNIMQYYLLLSFFFLGIIFFYLFISCYFGLFHNNMLFFLDKWNNKLKIYIYKVVWSKFKF
jgi:hypothetical protein